MQNSDKIKTSQKQKYSGSPNHSDRDSRCMRCLYVSLSDFLTAKSSGIEYQVFIIADLVLRIGVQIKLICSV